MDNVIEQNELNKHTIQRYRFKVLGSSALEENSFKTDKNEEEKIVVDSLHVQDKIDVGQNKFIEELLRKSDELSSNIIKLQMQIEKQEDEFQRRLKDDISREKEISSNEGYEKAKSELEANFNDGISNYTDSAKKLDDKVRELEIFLKKIESDVANTAVEIAKEVIKKEILSSGSSVATALSKELLSELKDTSKITLKVNPHDFSVLDEIYKDNDKIKVEADSAISKGGVVLLSENGNLDGNISARLEKVKYLLQDS